MYRQQPMPKRYNRDPYIGPSEAQAEALARRDSSYSAASSVSVSVQWDVHRRTADMDLRELVHAVRQAYADEVPTRLHEGYDSIGEGGTPKMHPAAEAYLFGRDDAGSERRDPETGPPALDYFRTPFRAAIASMSRGDRTRVEDAALAYRVAVVGMTPIAAAIAGGAPYYWAGRDAEAALRSFMERLSDLKVTLHREAQSA